VAAVPQNPFAVALARIAQPGRIVPLLLVAIAIVVAASGLSWPGIAVLGLIGTAGLFVYRDAGERRRDARELARLHKELQATMIYVTHDQVEAMTLGEKIVVFNAGRIEQAGAPLELYERPANLFVAGFLGSPRMNTFPATLVGYAGGLATVRTPGGGLLQVVADASQAGAGAPLTLGVRPEHLRLDGGGEGGIPGHFALAEYLGDVTLAYIQVEGVDGMVAAKCPPDVPLPPPGAAVRLRFDPARAWLFDAQGAALPALQDAVRLTG